MISMEYMNFPKFLYLRNLGIFVFKKSAGPIDPTPQERGLICSPLAHPANSVARWPKFRPKSSKGAGEKKIWPEEFMAELWPNFVKTGRKGAEEIF